MTAMLERTVEARLLAQCREAGLLCLKFTSPGRAGVPDRVVIAPRATVFVETKRPGGKLRRLQEVVIGSMRRAGAEVHVVDTVAGVDELVDRLAGKGATR
ncbi:nuclease [Enemella evansiae]|uniref:VRR-NUC domain-containing protein n=1 Tax=Enemella evansiae TaxID=2016499 RepID=UPI000B9666E4|nr:VRR-NUC domain-containing protein [Enemella evansiae]OYO00726.1 nuclease [Enemella evansiae]